MAKSKAKKLSSKKLAVLILLAIFVGVLLAVGIRLHFWRKHQSPDDIKSFVISSYNGTQLEDAQRSEMLTLTPNSCSLVVMSPTDGNFAPTTNCPMNNTIWNNITNAYFGNNFPGQSNTNAIMPSNGPIILLGVYYNDGTSNTVYYSRPAPTNLANFLNVLKDNQVINNSF